MANSTSTKRLVDLSIFEPGITVWSLYCVVCVQYVRHTVCYFFLRVGMIGVCSVSWRYVYIENIEMFVVG